MKGEPRYENRDAKGTHGFAGILSCGGQAEEIVPTQRNHYSILVPFVNDYFKWFVCYRIGKRVSKWHWKLRKKCDEGAVVWRESRRSIDGQA